MLIFCSFIVLFIVKLSRSEEELYRGVIRNYEEKQKELMLENSKMRDLLQQHSKHMTSLLNPQSSISPQDQQVGTLKYSHREHHLGC